MSARRVGVWPAVPEAVLGRPLPRRFRAAAFRLADADRLLVDLVDWLELGEPRGERTRAERDRLASALGDVRDRLPSRALDRLVTDALAGTATSGDEAGSARANGAASPNRRRGLWPRLPSQVLGRPLPSRFRKASVRFADPDRLLVAFIEWLESQAPPAAAAPDTDAHDREALVRVCIDLRERLGDSPLDAELREALVEVGVLEVIADGERFDAARHRAVGRVATEDAARHDEIAETERVGYMDHGRALVLPEVIVYRAETAAEWP